MPRSPKADNALANLVARVTRGEVAAVSRALSVVTDESDGHEELCRAFFPSHGRARKIGLCGPPGSGKSSLLNRLVSHLRKLNARVGVLAVDPTSPFTGGAFLGDRLRVQEHALDDHVFMRSLATRGTMGGVNATIFSAIHVLEASACDHILIETVGTGQDEVEIASVADTVVCVSAPYQGDEFQAMKAGAMEIGDIFAVNKADLAESDKAVASLREALSLGSNSKGGWKPQVTAVSALTGKGIAELYGLIARHGDFLRQSAEGGRRAKEQLRREMVLMLTRRITRDAVSRITDRDVEQLFSNKSDPVTLGRRILKKA